MASRPELDRGRHDFAAPVSGSLHFKLSARQAADREALLAAVQNPGSPQYHQWLTPEAYGARFGARPADIAKAKAWLESQGLTVDPPSRLGARLQFHGAAGQVEAAFRTELHDYAVGGKVHRAMSIAPSVPNELAGLVLGIHGVNDFRPVHTHHGRAVPADEDAGTGGVMSPLDMRTLYNLSPLLSAGTTGGGVNVVIVGEAPVEEADLISFRHNFQNGEPYDLTDVLVPGTGAASPTGYEAALEAAIDVEWAGAAAPGANLINVHVGNGVDDQGVTAAVFYVVEQGKSLPGVATQGPMIITESYSGCELMDESSGDVMQELAAAANLQGITYVAASGDMGSVACLFLGSGVPSVTDLAAMPGVTAVGGTEIPVSAQVPPFVVNEHVVGYPSSNGVSLETAWNDSRAPAIGTATSSGASAGGGGPSRLFRKPLYQLGRTPDDGARDVPDVALASSSDALAYDIVLGGNQGKVGGTSVATPIFAGITALLNQSLIARGSLSGLGNINPTLYGLASSTPSAFHDIVSGDNVVPCSPSIDPDCPSTGSYGGFTSGPGYDLVTGLGSIDATALVTAWSAMLPTSTSLVTSTSATSVGTPLSLTARVATTGTSPVGGTVTFVFESSTSNGAVANPTTDADVLVESYVLGSVAVTPLAGSPSRGTATLSAAIPPGAIGVSDVVAMYNGDAHYLSSQSQVPVAITVTGSSFAISPPVITVQPGSTTPLAATGGTAPVSWGASLGVDSTCALDPLDGGVYYYLQCSSWVSTGPTTAMFQAGGASGSVTIPVVDALGEVATITVTVAGDPVDGGALPEAGPVGGPPEAPPLEEGGTPVADEGGTPNDGGRDGGASSSGGCAVAPVGTEAGGRTLGPWLLAAFAFGARRRRARRA